MLTIVLLPLLVVSPARTPDDAPSQQAERYAAAGEEHLARAATPGEQQLDAFEEAHKHFDLAYLTAGDAGHLCRALFAAEVALSAGDFPDDQARLSWEEVRRDDLGRLRKQAAATRRSNCRFDAAGEPLRPRVALLADDDFPTWDEAPAPAPAAEHRQAGPDRGLRIRHWAHTATGAVFTTAGVGMLGLVAGILELERQRAVEMWSLVNTANAERRRFTDLEDRRFYDLAADLIRGRNMAIGVGVAGLVTLGTGIALLATRKKAKARAYALQPHGGRHGVGAVLRLNF